MKGIEEVFSKDKLVAIIYRKDIPVDGVRFLTDDNNPFQIGIHSRLKGIKLSPHIHKVDHSFVINSIQELLYVVSGKIRVTFYSHKGEIVGRKILTDGDSVLFISEGHGVDFLENSRIFEIKQGPYPGITHAKIFFK